MPEPPRRSAAWMASRSDGQASLGAWRAGKAGWAQIPAAIQALRIASLLPLSGFCRGAPLLSARWFGGSGQPPPDVPGRTAVPQWAGGVDSIQPEPGPGTRMRTTPGSHPGHQQKPGMTLPSHWGLCSRLVACRMGWVTSGIRGQKKRPLGRAGAGLDSEGRGSVLIASAQGSGAATGSPHGPEDQK